MAKHNEINFYLKDRSDKSASIPKKNAPKAQIWLYYSIGKGRMNRLEYYTGQRIEPEKWDIENKWIKDKYRKELSELIKALESLRMEVQRLADKARVLNIALTPKYFKEGLSKPDQKKTKETKKNIEDYISMYLKESENHKTKGTIRAIKASFEVFRDFAGDRDFKQIRGIETNLKLDFNAINREWYNHFLDYCFNERNYTNNYTGKCIKDLKAFLNWSYEFEYHSNDVSKKKWFKKLREEGEIIYLTYDELMYLYKKNLSKNRCFEQIRDVFCFACFTGMRFSDVSNLALENVFKDHITFRIKKGKEVNTVPLNKYSRAILDKYKGKLQRKCLPVISEKNTNEFLKNLFTYVKLTRKVQITHYKGAEAIKETLPLNKIITFHVSKKTFMTNFLAKGGNLTTAMAITGNKDVRTAKRYYTVIPQLKQLEMNRVFN